MDQNVVHIKKLEMVWFLTITAIAAKTMSTKIAQNAYYSRRNVVYAETIMVSYVNALAFHTFTFTFTHITMIQIQYAYCQTSFCMFIEIDCGISEGFRPNYVSTDHALNVQNAETIREWPWTSSIGFYNVSMIHLVNSSI